LTYKELLEAKHYYEAHLYDVNQKLAQIQQEGKPSNKQHKYIQRRMELQTSLQTIERELSRYQQYQQQSPQQQINQPTMPADWNPQTGRTENPGEGRRTAGKVLIGLGIMISFLGFIGNGGWTSFGIGLFLNFIGIILYASGNSAQGRSTSFVGGGFVSSGGGGGGGE
jgi:hypothetical protein